MTFQDFKSEIKDFSFQLQDELDTVLKSVYEDCKVNCKEDEYISHAEYIISDMIDNHMTPKKYRVISRPDDLMAKRVWFLESEDEAEKCWKEFSESGEAVTEPHYMDSDGDWMGLYSGDVINA